MKRVLTFDGNTEEGRERFAMLYQGFVMGGNATQGKGMEIIRREARILAAFEEVSDRPVDLPVELEGIRALRPGGEHEVELDVQDVELLRSYIPKAGWKVTFSAKVVALDDWLTVIQKTEPAPQKEK